MKKAFSLIVIICLLLGTLTISYADIGDNDDKKEDLNVIDRAIQGIKGKMEEKSKELLKKGVVEPAKQMYGSLMFYIKHYTIDITLELLLVKIIRTDSSFMGNKVTRQLQKLILYIALGFFGLLLTYIGFMYILGKRAHPMIILKKVIVSSIVLLILPTILQLSIELVNAMVTTISSITLIRASEFMTGNNGTGNVLYLIFILIGLVLIIRLLVYYYMRWFEIIFLYISSPFIIFLWLGGNENVAKLCIKEMIALLIVPIVHSLQLAILVGIAFSSSFFDGPFDQILLLIAAFLTMLKTPGWLQTLIHNIPDGGGIAKQVVGMLTFSRERKMLNAFTRSTKK